MSRESTFSDIPWVIESKFEPNRPRLDLIRRNRLLTQIIDGASKKLVLVVAPAGYGKSSLLGQWAAEAEERKIRYGWLTLEKDEADAKQFLAYIVLVLSRVGLQLDELVTGARDGFADAAVDIILPKLIRLLNAQDEQCVLVLEDYHSAECEAVNDIVKRLIRDTLNTFTLFIDSRRQPDIDAFSLIASGDAVEISASQLRLTKDETLQVVGDDTGASSGQEIYDQTEGWPVAVQLALVQKRAQPSEPILAGVDGGFVASYLTEQILSRLGEDTQELLLAFSFLERFNPELTNYVLDAPDAWSRIGSLSSFAALIVPLDATGGWYRLHHLFAEYLRDMQERRSLEWAKNIRRRASQWYVEKKQIVEAVRYAAYAEDYKECERIILADGGWKIILTEGIGILRNALRLLPDDVITSSPRLMVARAYLHSKYGEIHEARALLDASTKMAVGTDREQSDMDRLAVESMINLYEDRAEWTDEHKRLREHYSQDESIDTLGWGTIKCEEALIRLNQADFDGASEILRSAFSLMRQSASVLGLNYCYIHATHIAFYRGDLLTAGANNDRAGKMAEENFGSDSGLKAIASVNDYWLRIWRAECTQDDWPGFKDALFHTIDYDGWVTEYISSMEAAYLLSQQCDDPSHMFKVLDKIRVLSEQQQLPRLNLFLSLYEYAVGRGKGAAWSASDLISFASEYELDNDARNWQAYFFAAYMIGAEKLSENADEILDRAISLAERLGVGLWQVRLRVAKVAYFLEAGNRSDARSALFKLLKEPLTKQIMGPFLAENRIIRLLAEARSDLRHSEDELITLQFVNDILKRADALRPTKDAGLLREREYEVLLKLAEGLSNKEIARALELTENTVKFHLKSLFSKLNVSKRTQAVVEAQRRGIID